MKYRAMTYEKAYKKALERARAIYQGKYKPEIAATLAEALQSIFPELAEDERMWKLIKKYAHCNISDMALDADHITREQLESWLEKQSKQRPEVEYKAKDVENDICRECDNGNWLANLCWKGHSRCDGQNCIDFEQDEEL